MNTISDNGLSRLPGIQDVLRGEYSFDSLAAQLHTIRFLVQQQRGNRATRASPRSSKCRFLLCIRIKLFLMFPFLTELNMIKCDRIRLLAN
jgi:hypothetical protein